MISHHETPKRELSRFPPKRVQTPTRRVVALLAALVVCAACAREPVRRPTPTPSTPPTSSPIPSPTPEPRALSVCLSEEPDTLYIYGTDSLAARHVWEAIYDGPIDHQRYQHQPVILTQLPSIDDGSAALEIVSVMAGDRVLASGDQVLSLEPGVIVEDAAGQQVAFDAAFIPMARMVVTFTLRSDLRWADGEPLSAHDSVYSFHIAADPATPTDRYLTERTAGYRAVDGRTVVWEGLPGFLDHAYALNFWHPLPRHDWHGLSPTELLTSARSTREPLGWGPFFIRQWIHGERLEVERNPFYFRAGEGLPRLDRITFHFVETPHQLLDMLDTGTCDVVTHEAADGLLDVFDQADLPPHVRLLTTHDARWELLAFGISPGSTYERPDFFEDLRVRRGIAHCIDRPAVARASSGAGDALPHSYLPPEHPLYAHDHLTTWEYNPDAGQAYLAQAGWRDMSGDGAREAAGIPGIADGTPFQISYHTTDDPGRLRGAQLIQSDLRACGIDVTLHVLPAEELFAPGPEGVLFGRRFDLAQVSWRVTDVPLCDLFLSSQMPAGNHWSRPNVVGFISAEYDDACRRALQALPHTTDYVVGHTEAQSIFSEQLPALPLFGHQRITLVSTSVTGLIPTPSQPSELWNLERVSLQP